MAKNSCSLLSSCCFHSETNSSCFCSSSNCDAGRSKGTRPYPSYLHRGAAATLKPVDAPHDASTHPCLGLIHVLLSDRIVLAFHARQLLLHLCTPGSSNGCTTPTKFRST